MKRIFCIFGVIVLLLSFAGCNEKKDVDASGGDVAASSPKQSSEAIDIDLTTLSSTMVYSEVYNMMVAPEDYVGKTVRMRGQFACYEDPETKEQYFGCIISDATACCSQGLEFVLAGEHTYPQDYPALDTEVTVTGTFESYNEDGFLYCRLVNAVFE